MPITLLEARQHPSFAVSEMMMARAQRPGATRLWVEGADDASVIQRFRSACCTILVAGTRTGAIEIAKEAQRRGFRSGFLCLIDGDYARFDPTEQREVIPPRVAQIPHHPDIEGAIYYQYADKIIDGLFIHHASHEVPWIREVVGEPTLERLVRDVLAPLGALRVAWQRGGMKYKKFDLSDTSDRPNTVAESMVCSALQTCSKDRVENPATLGLLREFAPPVSDRDWTGLERCANSLLKSHQQDHWALVRGKDLSVAIGWLLYEHQHASLHRHYSLRAAVDAVHGAMRHSVGQEWVDSSGLADELRRHLSAEESLASYLLSPQGAAAAA